MKIASASDLHLDQFVTYKNFYLSDHDLQNESGTDVLVLAGDTMDTSMFNNNRVVALFGLLARSYKKIFYVMGNHEHYCGDFALTKDRLVELFKPFSNITVLEKEGVSYNGYRFFGGTMWTSFSNGNPMSMMQAKQAMNDYAWIKNSAAKVMFKTYDENGAPTFRNRPAKLLPDDVYEDHLEFVRKLNEDLNSHTDQNYVLITHHSPSYKMCSPLYAGSPINDLYHNAMDDLFYEHPNIKLAFMGHTHGKSRVRINECDVVLNARGYPGERTSFDYRFELTELP